MPTSHNQLTHLGTFSQSLLLFGSLFVYLTSDKNKDHFGHPFQLCDNTVKSIVENSIIDLRPCFNGEVFHSFFPFFAESKRISVHSQKVVIYLNI